MKYAIIYASIAGGTEQSAKIIKDKLCFEYQVPEENIDLIDLKKNRKVHISPYDRCILGTGIYAGKGHKLVRIFINDNLEKLLVIPLSLYICSLGKDKDNENYKNIFPKELLEHATPVSFFGGMIIFKRLNIFARLIMRMITKSKKDVHQLNHQVINGFVKEISES